MGSLIPQHSVLEKTFLDSYIGWMHLLFNCFALVSLGRAVEVQYGYVRFSAIFLTAGYAGGLLSLAWNGLGEFSAGTSGGVFGRWWSAEAGSF